MALSQRSSLSRAFQKWIAGSMRSVNTSLGADRAALRLKHAWMMHEALRRCFVVSRMRRALHVWAGKVVATVRAQKLRAVVCSVTFCAARARCCNARLDRAFRIWKAASVGRTRQIELGCKVLDNVVRALLRRRMRDGLLLWRTQMQTSREMQLIMAGVVEAKRQQRLR